MAKWRGYWRVYNVLVRALGLAALVFGLGFIVWGAARLMRLGLEADAGAPGVILVFAGIVAAALGATIIGTPTYRPDLGDPAWDFDPFGAKARKAPAGRRSWWTGDK
jgi:hypothetical protein